MLSSFFAPNKSLFCSVNKKLCKADIATNNRRVRSNYVNCSNRSSERIINTHRILSINRSFPSFKLRENTFNSRTGVILGSTFDSNPDSSEEYYPDERPLWQSEPKDPKPATLDDEALRALRRLDDSLVDPLLALQSSEQLSSLKDNIQGVTHWKNQLSQGLLPEDETPWPDEEFRTALLGTLKDLDMARFTRKHPPVTTTLMKNILEMLYDYESQLQDLEDMESDMETGDMETESQDEQQPGSSSEQGDGSEGNEPGEESNPDGQGGGGEGSDSDADAENMEMSMEPTSGEAEFNPDQSQNDKKGEMAKEIAEKLMEEFKEQWEPVKENLEAAEQAFRGLDGLMDGPKGFDLSDGLWQDRGWKEIDALRRKLEELKELRELVRELGRGAGKGPLIRTRAQVEQRNKPQGVVRTPMSPEETRGLTRSGDLALMVPSEAAMLAGSKVTKMMVKRKFVERTLLTYERSGWTEETSKVLDRTEVRPSATRGPIIVCLDTSGSMMGAREVVAKALTLECLRQANAQKRQCFVYAFSGPGDVQELELKVDAKSMEKMLLFLRNSFNGGTDVDEPLWRSLRRLQDQEWGDADMLLVTDGEIQPPDETLITSLNDAKEELGLKVHGLLVGEAGTPDVMETICTQIHEFKAWDKVKANKS